MNKSFRALRCACPCGCNRTTRHPNVGSPVLAQRARCTNCAASDHKSTHLAEPPQTRRTLTPIVTPSREDASLDAKILQDQQDKIRKSELLDWQSKLPKKFQNATTDNQRVKEALQRWRNGQPETAGLILLGDTGLGKTWTALGYANEAIAQHLIRPREILYGTEAELLASVANSAFGEVEPNLKRLTSRLYRMIIIDDVGRGHWLRDDWRQKIFALVLDAAWRDNKVVVVTTNLNNQALSDYVGLAAMDRMSSCAGYKSSVLLTGKNTQMRRAVTENSLISKPPRTI